MPAAPRAATSRPISVQRARSSPADCVRVHLRLLVSPYDSFRPPRRKACRETTCTGISAGPRMGRERLSKPAASRAASPAVQKAVPAAVGPRCLRACVRETRQFTRNCLRFPSLVLGKMPRPRDGTHFQTACSNEKPRRSRSNRRGEPNNQDRSRRPIHSRWPTQAGHRQVFWLPDRRAVFRGKCNTWNKCHEAYCPPASGRRAFPSPQHTEKVA